MSHETARRLSYQVWRPVRFLLILYLLVLLVFTLIENKLVYPSQKYPRGDWSLPKRMDLEEVTFTSADGLKLHGLLAEHAQPRGVMLYCHGNARNVTNWARTIAFLSHRYKMTILVFDYPGYGKSEGKPNEESVLASGHAAREWIQENLNVPPEELVLFGQSLGGAVAVDLAANGGAKALLLQSTFTSLHDAGAAKFPLFPVSWVMKNHYNSLEKIGRYDGPLLMCHGTKDRIVPYSLGRRLYRAAKCEKKFVKIQGGGHNTILPDLYFRELESFLDGIYEQEAVLAY